MLIYSIEDDKDIAMIINKALSKQGFVVNSFYDGTSFIKAFNGKKPDIILLDLMLPDMSGIDILKKIRSDEKNDDIHIIIISAKHMTMDKVEGLDYGADDYIEKPFDILELMSRVGAHARRLTKKNIYEIGPLLLDINKYECLYNNQKIILTTKEFNILQLLMEKYPNVVTREELFKKLWDTDEILESRTLDMHIKSLRAKLNNNVIKSIYGIGYQLQL
mgnify:FL=1